MSYSLTNLSFSDAETSAVCLETPAVKDEMQWVKEFNLTESQSGVLKQRLTDYERALENGDILNDYADIALITVFLDSLMFRDEVIDPDQTPTGKIDRYIEILNQPKFTLDVLPDGIFCLTSAFTDVEKYLGFVRPLFTVYVDGWGDWYTLRNFIIPVLLPEGAVLVNKINIRDIKKLEEVKHYLHLLGLAVHFIENILKVNHKEVVQNFNSTKLHS